MNDNSSTFPMCFSIRLKFFSYISSWSFLPIFQRHEWILRVVRAFLEHRLVIFALLQLVTLLHSSNEKGTSVSLGCVGRPGLDHDALHAENWSIANSKHWQWWYAVIRNFWGERTCSRGGWKLGCHAAWGFLGHANILECRCWWSLFTLRLCKSW